MQNLQVENKIDECVLLYKKLSSKPRDLKALIFVFAY
jgi:hypothetical protein